MGESSQQGARFKPIVGGRAGYKGVKITFPFVLFFYGNANVFPPRFLKPMHVEACRDSLIKKCIRNTKNDLISKINIAKGKIRSMNFANVGSVFNVNSKVRLSQ